MQIKLQNVRLAFSQNLFEPGVMEAGQDPKYSSTFILPPDHPQIELIKKTVETVAKEKWGDKYLPIYKNLVQSDKAVLHNGDTKTSDGFAGNLFVSASSKDKVKVVDANREELTKKSGRPYAGCYVNAIIDIWAQDNQYGKRINAKLGGVQYLRRGDAFLGSAPVSADQFDDVTDTGDDNPFAE